MAKTESGIPIMLNGLTGIGQQERIDFKIFRYEKSDYTLKLVGAMGKQNE
ncbi:hypothetical protein ACQKMD_20835 [Viridibacillus sp. NPDC096237]